MAQVSILNGVYTGASTADYRISLPVNLVPIATNTGFSAGYLRPAEGISQRGAAGGVVRGQIYWDGALHAVHGTSLVRVDSAGTVTVLGAVADGGPVRFTYSFDVLAVQSGQLLYYWDGSSLVQMTDPDLGICVDVVWIDGYFMSTDGTDIVVTELNDRLTVLTGKYASNEADPDPVVGLLRLRNEVYSLNRYTIQVFDNIGGALFPFAPIEGAQIQKGSIGTFASCVYSESVAFVGGGFNEAIGVYLANNGDAVKISTIEVDRILASFTEVQLADTYVESRIFNGLAHLYVHLPDRTMVFCANTTRALEQPVWFTLSDGLVDFAQYRGRYFTRAYDEWWAGDPASTAFGVLTEGSSDVYGQRVRWEFSTTMLFNENKGAIVSELEIIALPGRVTLGDDPRISTSHSLDGVTWSTDRSISAGKTGDRLKRLTWFRMGSFASQRVQRFRGASDAHISFGRLEAVLSPLAY